MAARLTDKITQALLQWCNVGAYDIVVPNWYHGTWEMDVMKITASHYQIEYEIKTSRADFKADFGKNRSSWRTEWENGKVKSRVTKKVHKHDEIEQGKRANRFYFVVPKGLVTKDEVPKYAGLIYYEDGYFEMIKNGPMIHKRLFTDYREVATKISFREFWLRRDLRIAKRHIIDLQQKQEKDV